MSDIQPLTAAERQQRSRAKKKGLADPFLAREKRDALIAARKQQHDVDLAWAQEQDAIGRYKSECRSCVELLGIFEGKNINENPEDEIDELDDADTVKEKKKRQKEKKKQSNWPNPSITKLTIRAIEWNGVLLEPNCDKDFKKLTEVDEVVSFQRWLDLRDKARKNLFWLGRLLGFGLFHSVHQYVCNQFVQKNFGGTGLDGVEVTPMYFEGYTRDDFHEMMEAQKRAVSDVDLTPCRELVLLEPRGAYKSTIDGIDIVQWLINCPDVRIMIISGVKSLSKKFGAEVKSHFNLPTRAEPSAFQLLFPEYILVGKDGRSQISLKCPAAFHNYKESSVWITSIKSVNTGDHCDVLKADDVVTLQNSKEQELREELKHAFYQISKNNLDGWGFADIIGTRYSTEDWYGTRALPNPETKRVPPYRYSCRGSWILTAEQYADYKSGALTISQIFETKCAKLLFPYKLGWEKLRNMYDEDRATDSKARNFRNQQLNEATDPSDESRYVNEFSMEALRAACIPKESAPKDGEFFETWDISYSQTKTSDFSVGISGSIFKNGNNQPSICIHEIIFDKWKSSELSFQILQFFKKWNSKTVLIEKANGADWLYENIRLTAGRYGVPDIVNHILLKEVDTASHAKRNRIKSLEMLLTEGRLFFVNGAWIDEAFKQLSQYNGEKSNSYRKDDIPDAMSFLLHFLPKTSLNPNATPEEVEREMDIQRDAEVRRAVYQRMFGNNFSQKPNTQAVEPPKTDPRKAMLAKILPPGMRI